jgi:hypothetical protein
VLFLFSVCGLFTSGFWLFAIMIGMTTDAQAIARDRIDILKAFLEDFLASFNSTYSIYLDIESPFMNDNSLLYLVILYLSEKMILPE